MILDPIKELTRVFMEIPFNKTLGLELQSLTDNAVEMSFDMQDNLIGNYLHGILHGGVISSVLDMAGGMATMIAAIQKHTGKDFEELRKSLGKSSTVNLSIDFVRPGKGTHFVAKAWIIHSGNKISFTQMELRNESSVLIATGKGTYLTA